MHDLTPEERAEAIARQNEKQAILEARVIQVKLGAFERSGMTKAKQPESTVDTTPMPSTKTVPSSFWSNLKHKLFG